MRNRPGGKEAHGRVFDHILWAMSGSQNRLPIRMTLGSRENKLRSGQTIASERRCPSDAFQINRCCVGSVVEKIRERSGLSSGSGPSSGVGSFVPTQKESRG